MARPLAPRFHVRSLSLMTAVAFLGLGAIGYPMARRVATSDIPLTIWNRTRARAERLAAESPAHVAATPAEAASEADVVITCLPTSSDVEGLLEGADGLLAGLRAGSVLVDCTSGDPAISRRIARRLDERGIGFLDAPVSGGVSGVERGTLTAMVGGSAELCELVSPVLRAFAQTVVHCGPVGTGHALKAVNNALLAVHIWSAAEGLSALEKAGVHPEVALRVINSSSGRSNTSEHLFPERVLTRAFPRTFRLALLHKDILVAASVAREQRAPAPLLQLTAELFGAARAVLGEEADHVEAVRVVEGWAGVEIGS